MARDMALLPIVASIRPVLEGLEDRRLLAASLDDGILTVDGTAKNDKIIVSMNKSGSRYTVSVGGDSQNFKAGPVNRIVINAGGGNDKVHFNEKAHRLGVSTVIYGGDGNDRITGSSRKDNIKGGAGRDFILGGGGHDKVRGGADDDTIFGDAGNDRLWGDAGNDILGGDDEGMMVLVGKNIPKQVSGNDRLDGGAGNDWLLGGIRYERGPDEEGNPNALVLLDDDDVDTLTGGDGNDVLGAYVSDDVITDRNQAEDDVPSLDVRAMSHDNHLHAQLNIRVRQSDGKLARVLVPHAIGGHVTGGGSLTGLDAVHTHGQSGRIHLEAADTDGFFMYEVFENWGLPLDRRLFARAQHSSGAPIKIKVMHENGDKESITNLADYQIQDEDIITVTVG